MIHHTNFKPNRLISIDDIDLEDINTIYSTTLKFHKLLVNSNEKSEALAGIIVANLFFEDSTRTRLSFELAEKRLSAEIVNFTVSSSSIKKGETLIDTIQNILRMNVDCIVIRDSRSGVPKFISDQTGVPIINAGDGTNEHPTQALLDLFTLWKSGQKSEDIRFRICGDIKHSRVAGSSIKLWDKLGIKYLITGPYTTMTHHQQICKKSDDMHFNTFYTLRIQKERQNKALIPSLDEYNHFFGLKVLTDISNPIIMHPGPINRNVEIDSCIADCNHSLILDQVEMGVALRMAVICLLAQKKKEAIAS